MKIEVPYKRMKHYMGHAMSHVMLHSFIRNFDLYNRQRYHQVELTCFKEIY